MIFRLIYSSKQAKKKDVSIDFEKPQNNVNLGFGIVVSKKTRRNLFILFCLGFTLISPAAKKYAHKSPNVVTVQSEEQRRAQIHQQIQDIINSPSTDSQGISTNNYYVPSINPVTIPKYKLPEYSAPIRCKTTLTEDLMQTQITGWETTCNN
jgi:hypothetical protein